MQVRYQAALRPDGIITGEVYHGARGRRKHRALPVVWSDQQIRGKQFAEQDTDLHQVQQARGRLIGFLLRAL